MTTLQVHLLMLGLGILAFLLLAGVFGTRKSRSQRPQRQWILGALAGLAVAVSPFSRFWRAPGNGIDLVTQSLLIAAISLLALLLIALLRAPYRALTKPEYKRETNQQLAVTLDGGLSPIVINADANDDAYVELELTPERTTQPVAMYDAATYHDPLRATAPTVDDQADTTKFAHTTIESVVPMSADTDGTHQLDDSLSQSSAANDQTTTVDDNLDFEESLDLSETEQLFAEIRAQRSEIELPDDQELLDATQSSSMEELDLETDLLPNDAASAVEETSEFSADVIEEAEVMDADETHLEFGNDLTGEYAHPDGQTTQPLNFVDTNTAENVKIPETLDHALIAAKVSAFSLQAQVATLEDSIVELDGLRDQSIDVAKKNIVQHEELISQSNSLLAVEDDARHAAESVIAAQSALIERAKHQQAAVDALLKQERHRLALLRDEVERSRKMARTAAHLARKAAIAQQEIRTLAKREQTARLKSQESTRKAVSIARNAISALAAEERKRGLTRH